MVAQGRKIIYRGVHGCFHDVAESVMAELPKPDAIFALNSGLIFYPTWADTVVEMIQRVARTRCMVTLHSVIEGPLAPLVGSLTLGRMLPPVANDQEAGT